MVESPRFNADHFPAQPCAGCQVELTREDQVHRLEYENISDDEDYGAFDIEVLYCFACTWLQNRETVLAEVHRTVAAIRDGRGSRLFNDLWRHGNEALMWLYMLDEHHRNLVRRREDYEARKAAEAPALRGLIWVRGAAQHGRLWEFDRYGMRSPSGSRFLVPTAVWKAHPDDGTGRKAKSGKGGREASEPTPWQCYDEHVADHAIEEPLSEAEQFVSGLNESFWFPEGVDRRAVR